MAKLISTAIDADDGSETLTRQVFAFFGHTLIALAVWAAVMLVGYIVNPAYVPQVAISVLSFVIPCIAGAVVVSTRPSEIAPHIWLAGIIWMLFLSLWLLDLPTGPNACDQCAATEKIVRSFFSYPSPSGLIDDNGPFFGTWPAIATIGYGIGAGILQARRKKQS